MFSLRLNNRFLFFFLALTMLFLAMASDVGAEETKLKVNNQSVSPAIMLSINDKLIETDVPPILDDNRVLVPIRVISENLGAKVDYISSLKEVTINSGYRFVQLTVNKQEAWINNELATLDVPAKIVNGRTLVPVRFVSEALGAQVKWLHEEKAVVISTSNQLLSIDLAGIDQNKETATLKFEAERPLDYNVFTLKNPTRLIIDLNSTLIEKDFSLPDKVSEIEDLPVIRWSQYKEQPLIGRVVLEGQTAGQYQIKTDDSGNLLVTFPLKQEQEEDARKIIVIDPGHGGKDPGAMSSSGTKESDIVLKVALELEKMLKNEDYEVYLTRETDKYVVLQDRPQFANNIGSTDAYISIHTNSAVTSTPKGTETYYHNTPKDSRSALLAKKLQQAVTSNLSTVNRGVKQANFCVVRETIMPSALVELAFISNPEEESMFLKSDFPKQAAKALFEGIVEFMDEVEELGLQNINLQSQNASFSVFEAENANLLINGEEENLIGEEDFEGNEDNEGNEDEDNNLDNNY